MIGSRLTVVLLLAACVVSGCSTTSHATQTTTAQGSVPANTALATLDVIPRRPFPGGYDRSCDRGRGCVFGPAWTDNTDSPGGHNGCDTRDDILAAQLQQVIYKSGSRCVVVEGTLNDPYTGQTIHFTKAHAIEVQIDHIVPLALAWDLGAHAWPLQRRLDFANDPAELLAVSQAANDAKGDDGPAKWLPPNQAEQCSYVTKFVQVLAGYKLPITSADKTTVANVLAGCR